MSKGDSAAGVLLRSLCDGSGLLSGTLIAFDHGASHKSRLCRRGGSFIGRWTFNAHNQVRRIGFLDKENIDLSARANESDVGCQVLGEGFEIRDIGGAGKVPVIAIADYEIEDLLGPGQNDNGRVADLGTDPGNLVVRFGNTKDAGGSGVGRRSLLQLVSTKRGREEEGGKKRGGDIFEEERCHGLPRAKWFKASARPYWATALSRCSASRWDEV